jgi:hypothetical protein
MKAMMGFTFPDVAEEFGRSSFQETHSIRDFQCNFIYHTIPKGFREKF